MGGAMASCLRLFGRGGAFGDGGMAESIGGGGGGELVSSRCCVASDPRPRQSDSASKTPAAACSAAPASTVDARERLMLAIDARSVSAAKELRRELEEEDDAESRFDDSCEEYAVGSGLARAVGGWWRRAGGEDEYGGGRARDEAADAAVAAEEDSCELFVEITVGGGPPQRLLLEHE